MASIEVGKTMDISPYFFNRLRELVQEVMEGGARDVVDEAQALVPVDTGTLRDSIRAEIDGPSIAILAGGDSINTSGEDYASFVEYGTIHMAAQPFLEPAWEAVFPSIDASLASLLNGYRSYSRKGYARRTTEETELYGSNKK